MSGSPSRYGGIAAVMVLGIGLLIVGFNLPAAQHAQAVGLRWTGAFVSMFGLLFMGFSLSQTTALKALYVTLGAAICCGAFVYLAASNEISGTATYRPYLLSKGKGEAVTRESAPAKFRAATNVLWGGGALCLVVSVIGFTVFRKVDE